MVFTDQIEFSLGYRLSFRMKISVSAENVNLLLELKTLILQPGEKKKVNYLFPDKLWWP